MRGLRWAGGRARELGNDRKAIYLTRGVLKIRYKRSCMDLREQASTGERIGGKG